MPPRLSFRRRWTTAARWPLGVGLASWRYLWRVSAVHRWEMSGSLPSDGAPALPDGVRLEEVQTPDDGVGPFVHRMYRTRIVGSVLTPERLMERLKHDPNRVAPSEFATFQKVEGGGPNAGARAWRDGRRCRPPASANAREQDLRRLPARTRNARVGHRGRHRGGERERRERGRR